MKVNKDYRCPIHQKLLIKWTNKWSPNYLICSNCPAEYYLWLKENQSSNYTRADKRIAFDRFSIDDYFIIIDHLDNGKSKIRLLSQNRWTPIISIPSDKKPIIRTLNHLEKMLDNLLLLK
jgi:hypothetical protein